MLRPRHLEYGRKQFYRSLPRGLVIAGLFAAMEAAWAIVEEMEREEEEWYTFRGGT